MKQLSVIASVLMATIVIAGYATPSWGHHILGVPHYSYSEDYPQTPFLTYAVKAEGYTVKVTGNPGHPVPGEPTGLHVYVKNELTGKPYPGTVTVSVFEERFMRTERLVYGPSEAQREEAIFKFSPIYENVANYQLHIEFHDDKEWSIVLPVVAGEPKSPWISIGLTGGGIALALLIFRAIRIKSRRRSKREEKMAVANDVVPESS